MAAAPSTKERRPLSRGEKWIIALVGVPIIVGLAAFGFAMSFQTIMEYTHAQGLPPSPFSVPAGEEPEIGDYWVWPLFADVFVALLLFLDWLFTRLGRDGKLFRLAAFVASGYVVMLNISAHAEADGPARFLQAMAPVVWVVAVEAVRLLVADRVRTESGSAMDRVRVVRWVMFPVETARIRRRMVRWEITNYSAALARESAILTARSVARAELDRLGMGRSLRRLPDDVKRQLRTGLLPAKVSTSVERAQVDTGHDWQATVKQWIKTEMAAAFGQTPRSAEGVQGRTSAGASTDRKADPTRTQTRTGHGPAGGPEHGPRHGPGPDPVRTGHGPGPVPATPEERLALARKLNAEHIQKHGRPISAETLRPHIGGRMATVRNIVKEIRETSAPSTPLRAVK